MGRSESSGHPPKSFSWNGENEYMLVNSLIFRNKKGLQPRCAVSYLAVETSVPIFGWIKIGDPAARGWQETGVSTTLDRSVTRNCLNRQYLSEIPLLRLCFFVLSVALGSIGIGGGGISGTAVGRWCDGMRTHPLGALSLIAWTRRKCRHRNLALGRALCHQQSFVLISHERQRQLGQLRPSLKVILLRIVKHKKIHMSSVS
jgi:hypothetical protein